MNAIHIIMATSTSANPHDVPNERIETMARKRKISAFTFFGSLDRSVLEYLSDELGILVFGILLIVAGALLASFESQRFSVSFIVFGYALTFGSAARHVCFSRSPFSVCSESCLPSCTGFRHRES